MWYAKECKENGYMVTKKYKWDIVQFDAWDNNQKYMGIFHTAPEAFLACESHFIKQTQTKAG